MTKDFFKANRLQKTIKEIDAEIDELERQLARKRKIRQNYNSQIYSLKEDYHAVIPVSCATHSDWNYSHKTDIPWSNVRVNRYRARELQLCCNTFQEVYHIVPLTKEEVKSYQQYLKTQ